MARYVDAIDLPIPIEEAFAYLADFSHTAEWDPGVVGAQRISKGRIGIGSRFRVTVRFAGTTLSLVYEITEFEPPNRIVLVGEDAAIRSIDEIGFLPRGDGTRVTYEARIELRGLRKLADPLVDLAFRRIGQLAARGLRERIDERLRRGKAGSGRIAKRSRKRSGSGAKPIQKVSRRSARAEETAKDTSKRSGAVKTGAAAVEGYE